MSRARLITHCGAVQSVARFPSEALRTRAVAGADSIVTGTVAAAAHAQNLGRASLDVTQGARVAQGTQTQPGFRQVAGAVATARVPLTAGVHLARGACPAQGAGTDTVDAGGTVQARAGALRSCLGAGRGQEARLTAALQIGRIARTVSITSGAIICWAVRNCT